MKVLILGKGFIGTNLAKFLSSKEDVKVTHLSKKDLDYTMNPYKLCKHIEYVYDRVINASGYTGKPNVDACEDDKEACWYYNVVVPANISKACAEAGVELFHISSGCIYNGYDKEFTEDDTPNFGMFSDESSYYSKTKHAAETVLMQDYLLRIRIPFTSQDTDRNYINKLLNYNNLISMQNSMTCLEDFNEFVHKFIESIIYKSIPPGVYNVTNKGSMEAKEVVKIMNDLGLRNPNHKFIELSELNTRANRSNCVLSTKKIEDLDLALPDIKMSMKSAIMKLALMRSRPQLEPIC